MKNVVKHVPFSFPVAGEGLTRLAAIYGVADVIFHENQYGSLDSGAVWVQESGEARSRHKAVSEMGAI